MMHPIFQMRTWHHFKSIASGLWNLRKVMLEISVTGSSGTFEYDGKHLKIIQKTGNVRFLISPLFSRSSTIEHFTENFDVFSLKLFNEKFILFSPTDQYFPYYPNNYDIFSVAYSTVWLSLNWKRVAQRNRECWLVKTLLSWTNMRKLISNTKSRNNVIDARSCFS